MEAGDLLDSVKQFIVRIMRTINYEFYALFGICSFIVDKNKCMNCKTRENSEKKKEIEKNVKKIKKSG